MSHQDPYVEKATHEASLATKVHELHEIMERSKVWAAHDRRHRLALTSWQFAMLTTHGSTGLLHTRAMAPCSAEGLVFSFLCNSDSGKCGDIAQDSQVNISFSDASTTHWASVAGKASLVSGADKVKPFYTTEVKAVRALLVSSDADQRTVARRPWGRQAHGRLRRPSSPTDRGRACRDPLRASLPPARPVSR